MKKQKKSPAFLNSDYPLKKEAVSEGEKIESEKLYELSCPNCQLVIRLRSSKVAEMRERIKKSGCPGCKIQFDGHTYSFKDGEKVIDLPQNNGRFSGFDLYEVEIVE